MAVDDQAAISATGGEFSLAGSVASGGLRAGISSNARAFRRRMEARALGMEDEQAVAADQIAKLLTQRSRAILQREVYDIPPKQKVEGGSRWTWSHQLINAEKFVVVDKVNVEHHNDAPHSLYRYRLGMSGQRQPIPPQRSSQWYRDAILRSAKDIQQLRHDAMTRTLSRTR